MPVVAAGVMVAGAVGSAMAQRSAAKKAAKAQKDALDNVSGVNVKAVQKEALKADRERFENQFKLQEEVDPTLAAVREKGAGNLLANLQDDPQSNRILNQLAKEGAQDSPKRQALIDQLLAGAEEEIAQGASLPPEFQAELIRAGLEKSSGAGLSSDYRAAAGVGIRKLLGSAGMELQAFRRGQAANLLATADAAKQNRLNALSTTLGALEGAASGRTGRAVTGYGVGAAGVPQAGLSGADVANLAVTNTQIANEKAMGRGQIAANEAVARGQFISGLIGAGTSLAGAGIGAFGNAGGAAGTIAQYGGTAPSNLGALSGLQQRQYANAFKRNAGISSSLYE